MENWVLILLFAVGGFIISLFFEDVREFYGEYLEIVWEGIQYFFTFEWFSDIWEIIGSAFENISEFSVYGLGFGASSVILIFFLKDYMITPFVQYYSPVGRMFWTILTFIAVFLGGYFLGRGFENTA